MWFNINHIFEDVKRKILKVRLKARVSASLLPERRQ